MASRWGEVETPPGGKPVTFPFTDPPRPMLAPLGTASGFLTFTRAWQRPEL
jgi:hypothetical protein